MYNPRSMERPAEDLGPIVIDPHAFKQLWPALAVWLALFLTAGDAATVVPRAVTLAFGTPAEARVTGKRKASVAALLGRERRYYVEFSYTFDGAAREGREPVGHQALYLITAHWPPPYRVNQMRHL